MTDFSVYLTSIGNDSHQMFIKNNTFYSDFIRVIIGYTEIESGRRVGNVADSWIISPLKSTNEPVFIQSTNKQMMHGKRIWVAFEAIQRDKPKNKTLGSFMALSPTVGTWRSKIGATTKLELRSIKSFKSLEDGRVIPPSLADRIT